MMLIAVLPWMDTDNIESGEDEDELVDAACMPFDAEESIVIPCDPEATPPSAAAPLPLPLELPVT